MLDYIQRQEPIPEFVKRGIEHLLEQGIVERIGRGRGVRFLLSRRFYSFLGRRGRYTRERGLDRATQKELLVRHIQEAEPEGARLADLQDVLRDFSRKQVQTLLRELRDEGRVTVVGVTRSGRWHQAPSETSNCSKIQKNGAIGSRVSSQNRIQSAKRIVWPTAASKREVPYCPRYLFVRVRRAARLKINTAHKATTVY